MKTSIKTGILYIQEWEYQQIAHKVRKWSEKFQKAKSISLWKWLVHCRLL